MKEQSLRERSKARRRIAIARTAMRLFAERGYEATTIADIAAEAEVAPRTVSLYFPSKAALALSYADAVAERINGAFAARAPAETALDLFDRWLLAEGESSDTEVAHLSAAMFEANPTLRGIQSVQLTEAVEGSSRALAEYLGVGVDHLAVRIAGGAIAGVVNAYLAALAAGTDMETAHSMVMRMLRAGIDALLPATD
jgi:AcrR family transcriptional regulator